jgi:hypothetical protein
MKTVFLSILNCILFFSIQAQKSKSSEKIDYQGFKELTDSLSTYREDRLIDQQTFLRYSDGAETIILDTCSKSTFDEVHLDGAVHLNFSDFTAGKLEKVIPSKTTRILIYCNNNFESDEPALENKGFELALNIPTFINLYGYGYKNIYELGGYLEEEESLISLIKND